MHKPKTGALTQSYTYDARGNRAAMTVTGTESYAVSYAYDANNRLLTEQKTQGLLTDLTTYIYDANGNLLSKTVLAGNGGAAGSTYAYNTLNQLVSATENQRTAAYAYNTQGIRTTKVTFSTRTDYLLDGANVVGERLNGEYVSYLRGANLISRTSGDETDFYLFNAHGDVTGLADSTGTNTRTYDYDAFGVEKDSDPLDENPFRYCGEYFDRETETYYLRARYYDPTIGRFTQQDTHWTTANSIYGDNPQKINEREDKLGLKTYSYAPQITAVMQSGNLYVYCCCSPIQYQDTSGTAMINIVFAAIGAVAGWAFGDYMASKLGLDGWKYWAVRGAVTVGGAAIGWFAGTAISKVAATYLSENPTMLFKLGASLGSTKFVFAMKFLGINPFETISDSGKFIGIINKFFNTPKVQVGLDWAKTIIQKAQEFGYDIRLDSGHPGTKWEEIAHLNIGKYHVAIDPKIWDLLLSLLEGK